MYKLLLSVRFFRMRKINLLSVVCIALGVMVLIIVYSVLEGFQTKLKNSFRSTIPHVLIEQFQPSRRDQYIDVIRNVPGVTGVAARVETVGLIGWMNDGRPNTIASPAGQKGIYVLAIDPGAEESVTQFKSMLSNISEKALERGLKVENVDDPFRISDALRGDRMECPGIIVGEELASHLKLKRGAEVTIFSVRLNPNPGPGEAQLTPSNETFYLAGVFKSGMYDQNLFSVYIPLAAGRKLMRRAGYSAEKIAIGTADFDNAREVKVRIAEALKEAGCYGQRITTWEDRNRPLLSALVVEKRVLTVLMFFLVLMACGTILAILYMMVLEKRREIGILKALGAPMRGLLQLFLINGGVIGLLGAIFGVGAGLLFLYKINTIEAFLSNVCGLKVFSKEVYVFEELPVVYDVPAIMAMAVATVLFSFLAALVPAYIAARADAVKSLRNE